MVLNIKSRIETVLASGSQTNRRPQIGKDVGGLHSCCQVVARAESVDRNRALMGLRARSELDQHRQGDNEGAR